MIILKNSEETNWIELLCSNLLFVSLHPARSAEFAKHWKTVQIQDKISLIHEFVLLNFFGWSHEWQNCGMFFLRTEPPGLQYHFFNIWIAFSHTTTSQQCWYCRHRMCLPHSLSKNPTLGTTLIPLSLWSKPIYPEDFFKLNKFYQKK